MATVSTDQGLKDVISPGTGQRYQVRLIWDLDPTTRLPVNVRLEYVFA